MSVINNRIARYNTIMETIEERAKEYVSKYYDDYHTDAELAFIRGAQSEHEQLTEWYDPKKELPPIGVSVLLKIEGDGLYVVNNRTIHPILGEGWGNEYAGILDEQIVKVLGWRYIHE